MNKFKFDDAMAKSFIGSHEVDQIKPFVSLAHSILLDGTGAGAEFTDWLQWPDEYDKDEFTRIKEAAAKIQSDSDVLVVIGIGGSYLGARAAIEFLKGNYYNFHLQNENKTQVFFVGNSISATNHQEVLNIIGDRDFSINVISKSGTTTEPSIAFRIFKNKLIEKYGEAEANQRIYATTDQVRGALKSVANQKDYQTFVIPDGIGGRFTVLTAVGLLPIAVAGGDIDLLMEQASEAMERFTQPEFEANEVLQYVAMRNILHRKGKDMEILVNYEPALQYFAEWWKQLFGESEGKDQKGIFPVSANFSTDLHSIGQIIQDGQRNIFETVLTVDHSEVDITIPSEEVDIDGLKYLEGQTMNYVNQKAFEGTVLAHTNGLVPNLQIAIDALDETSLAYLIVFFEVAVGVSGYLNGVNPFNQPGVEEYKRNMFALLEKPGYEDLTQALKNQQTY